MKKVKLAVVGVGNCASSLIQGIEYYRQHHNEHSDGIMQAQINGWRPQDIKIVAAFDVDKRKVGLPIAKAIFAKPNCTTVFQILHLILFFVLEYLLFYTIEKKIIL